MPGKVVDDVVPGRHGTREEMQARAVLGIFGDVAYGHSANGWPAPAVGTAEPQRGQKCRQRLADDWYALTLSAPRTHRKSSRAMVPTVANTLPWNLRHMEQWQWPTMSTCPPISNAMSPHRQLPVDIM